MQALVRDAVEVLLVIAVGGMLWSAISRMRRGQIEPYRCQACGRATSRAYPRCGRCGAHQPER